MIPALLHSSPGHSQCSSSLQRGPSCLLQHGVLSFLFFTTCSDPLVLAVVPMQSICYTTGTSEEGNGAGLPALRSRLSTVVGIEPRPPPLYTLRAWSFTMVLVLRAQLWAALKLGSDCTGTEGRKRMYPHPKDLRAVLFPPNEVQQAVQPHTGRAS